MKHHFWVSYAITIILISVFLGMLNLISSSSNNSTKFISPIPSFLTIGRNNQVTTLNLWLPQIVFAQMEKDKTPQIFAKAALVYDTTSGKTLFAKNESEKLPMASLTKIMTAIIALENGHKDDLYIVAKSDLVGEDSMGLSAGETLSMEELLYGLMLSSGNDAAEVLARNYSLGRDGFILAMNEKVKALGLSNTHFTNPTGLQGDGDQYTSASDLLVITNYAISNFPLFGKIVSTFDYTIPYTKDHKAFYLENQTNLLTSYPGVKGVKTGYTPEAELCLVTYLEYGGHKIIGVILGSQNRRDEMKKLLDYSLKSLGIPPPPHG